MAIGTAAALMGAGLAANAGLGAWGASKQAGAAKDTSQQQVEAANQAKAELRPLYEQNVARLNPYADLGGAAVGQLRALGGFPAVAQGAQAVGRMMDGSPQGPFSGPMNMSDPRVQHLARGGSLLDMPGGMTPDQSAQVGAGARQAGSAFGGSRSLANLGGGGGQSSFGMPNVPGGMGQPQMVKVMAPDGEVREFPMEQAQHFVQRGAQIVS